MYPVLEGCLLRDFSLDAQDEHQSVKLPNAALLDADAHPE
jgi:hypothetical protein